MKHTFRVRLIRDLKHTLRVKVSRHVRLVSDVKQVHLTCRVMLPSNESSWRQYTKPTEQLIAPLRDRAHEPPHTHPHTLHDRHYNKTTW